MLYERTARLGGDDLECTHERLGSSEVHRSLRMSDTREGERDRRSAKTVISKSGR
jgi:hypothetical protein